MAAIPKPAISRRSLRDSVRSTEETLRKPIPIPGGPHNVHWLQTTHPTTGKGALAPHVQHPTTKKMVPMVWDDTHHIFVVPF